MKTFLQRTLSCLIIFVCLLVCVGVKQVVNAETGQYSYDFTAKTISANGTIALGDANWTVSGDGGYWGYNDTKGQQLGSGNNPYKTLTLSTDYFNDKNITKVTINTSGASSINATMDVTINGSSVGSQSLTSTATSYSFDVDSLFGVLAFNFTQTSSKAIYVKSIVVDYEVQGEVSYTDLFTVNTTKSSLNLKWNIGESSDEQYFEKVTTTPTDWDGNYLIVCEDSMVAFNGSLTTLDAVNNNVSVSIENNKITYDSKLDISTFTIDSNGYVKSKSGYYIGQTSDANGLKSSTTSPYTNTITFNDDGTVNLLSGGAYLRYNAYSNQCRFRYYKSSSYTGQQAISLYKFVGSSDEYSITNASVRFGATIEQELYEGLISEGSNVSFGVVVAKVNDLESSTLVEAYEANNSAVKSVTFTKEEVLANGYTFAVLITNVPESFFAEDFVAACYVEIDGETYYMSERQISFIEILYEYTQKEVSDNFSQENKDLLTVLYNVYK